MKPIITNNEWVAIRRAHFEDMLCVARRQRRTLRNTAIRNIVTTLAMGTLSFGLFLTPFVLLWVMGFVILLCAAVFCACARLYHAQENLALDARETHLSRQVAEFGNVPDQR